MESCPLEGECKVPNLVYKAEVEAGGESRYYIGQTAITFKKRYRLHKCNIKLGKKKSTALTRHLVELEEKGVVPDKVKWSKVQIAKPRQRGQKVCQLCLSEKTNIAVGGAGILIQFSWGGKMKGRKTVCTWRMMSLMKMMMRGGMKC